MYPHILKIPFSTLKVWKLVRYPHVFEFQLMPFLLFFPLSLLLGRFPSFFFFCVLLHLLLLHVLFLFLSRQPPVRSLLVVAIGSIDGCLAIPTISAAPAHLRHHFCRCLSVRAFRPCPLAPAPLAATFWATIPQPLHPLFLRQATAMHFGR